MKKIITLTLAIIMVLGCFAGCSGDSYKEDTVMVVNGTEVSFDEYCYWLGYSASYLQYVYSSYTGSSAVDWDAASPLDENQTNFEWCVANTKETIVKSCIVEAEFNDRGLKLSDEDKAEIDETLKTAAENWCGKGADQEKLREYLAGVNINYDYYKKNLEMNLISNALFADMYGENGEKLKEADVLKYAEENGYVNANHILIQTKDPNGTVEYSDAEIARRTELAKQLSDELRAISDTDEMMTRFAELKAEYCDDLLYRAKCTGCEKVFGIHKKDFDEGKLSCPNCGTANKADSFMYSDNAEGYEFAKGAMVEEFYNCCLSLKEYEVSEPVKSTYGYHIIVRLPLDTAKSIIDPYASSSMTLAATVADKEFSDMLDGKAKKATVEFVNGYEASSFKSMFTESGFTLTSYEDYKASKESSDK